MCKVMIGMEGNSWSDNKLKEIGVNKPVVSVVSRLC